MLCQKLSDLFDSGDDALGQPGAAHLIQNPFNHSIPGAARLEQLMDSVVGQNDHPMFEARDEKQHTCSPRSSRQTVLVETRCRSLFRPSFHQRFGEK